MPLFSVAHSGQQLEGFVAKRAKKSISRSHPNQIRASTKKKLRKKEKALELELEAIKLGLSIPELQQKKFVEAMEAARKRRVEADRDGWVPRNARTINYFHGGRGYYGINY